MKQTHSSIDFSGGSPMRKEATTIQIAKKLITFSIPLILSGLFQQLFNWVDALIVGNIVGETALAAVGATSSIYNMFITLIVGFTSGLSVLAAQQFGKGDHSQNSSLLWAYTLLLGVLFVLICILGIIFIEPILQLMDTPAALFNDAKIYLQIVFIGIPFLAVYNTYAAVLRGVGNSALPFRAVLVSSGTNAVLDLILVAVFRLGVLGAAAATMLSQAAMTVFIVIYSSVKYPTFRFHVQKDKTGMIRAGFKFGLPPAIQSGVSSVGSVFLQRFMNGFGEQTVAAITTAYRVDCVLLLPIINFSTAISTMVAQGIGAGNPKLADRIFRLGMGMMAVLSITLTAVILILGEPLLTMFGLTGQTVLIGRQFFRAICVFYLVYGLSMAIKGFLEGSGDLVFSGFTGICALIVRLICSYWLAGMFGNMVVAYAEACSWLFMLVLFFLRYLFKQRTTRSLSV